MINKTARKIAKEKAKDWRQAQVAASCAEESMVNAIIEALRATITTQNWRSRRTHVIDTQNTDIVKFCRQIIGTGSAVYGLYAGIPCALSVDQDGATVTLDICVTNEEIRAMPEFAVFFALEENSERDRLAKLRAQASKIATEIEERETYLARVRHT